MGKNNYRISIMIANKDRPTELAMLLESLYFQTYQDFDITILDDGSGTQLQSYYFLTYMIQRLKIQGHNVRILRNNIPVGVSKARQQLVNFEMKYSKNELYCRIDDDSVCKEDMLEKLVEGIKEYDLVGCIVSLLVGPEMLRETRFVEPIIGECRFNNKGKLIMNHDDCGYNYLEEKLIPTHHFRSSCLYKKELHEKGVNYNSRLSKNGFREEQIFSFKAILKGFKLAIHTGAICYHLATPSGGERDTMDMTQFNQQIFEETAKKMYDEHGDFLHNYNKKLGLKEKEYSELELKKKTNLV